MFNKKALASALSSSVTTDANFKQTTLLLHGDGTNGSQNNTFVDSASSLPSYLGYAGYFDGSGDYLTIPSSTQLAMGSGDFTAEFWIYRQALADHTIFDYSSTGGFGCQITATQIQCFVTVGTVYAVNTVVPANSWNHIAFVRSGTTLTTYLNGVSQGTFTSSVNFTSPSTLNIGRNPGGNSAFINGYISNLRFVKGTALYTANFSPPTAPLTAVTNTTLLTCQSSSFVDNSSNNFAITANGDAKVTGSLTPITRVGNVTQGSFSPFSAADGYWSNYFDGTGDYITGASNTGLAFGTGDFTVECWVYVDNPSAGSNGNQGILNINDYATGILLRYSLANGYLVYFNGTFYASNITTARTWVHLAFVRSGSTIRFFVNGTQTNTGTDALNVTGATLTIGVSAHSSTEALVGYVSNVRAIKGTALYSAAFTPPTTPLTAVTNTSLLTCQSNRFKDGSSSNIALTPAGDVRVTTFGPFAPTASYSAATNGGSMYFDGTGDYLVTPQSTLFVPAANEDFTVEAWVYLTATPSAAHAQIVGLHDGGTTADWVLLVNSSLQVFFYTYTGNAFYTNTATPLRLNSWQHVAVSRSGTSTNNLKVFVNGVGQSFTSNSTTAGGGNPLSIGADQNGDSALFSGYISNVRIVKGTGVYTNNFTPPTTPLTAVASTSLLLNGTDAGIVDSTGKNVIETVGNARISTAVKKYGTGAMYFDGTGDWLVAPRNWSIATSENFTVECWFYLTAAQASYRMIVGDAGGASGKYIAINSAGVEVQFGAGLGPIAYGDFIFSQNTWYHLAVVRNSGTVTIYVNGSAATMTQSAQTGSFLDQGTILYVGRWSGTTPYEFPGYIDDLRITKGVARYTANFTPPALAFADQ